MSFERALRAAARKTRSDAGLVALSGGVESDPEQLAPPRGSPWAFWDTRRRSDLPPELSMGIGAARVASARGPFRFAEARARLAATLGEIERLDGARVRAFGGLAFEAGALGPFAPLGDLRFVVPRWTFTRTAGQTRLTLIAEPRELAHPDALLAELEVLSRPRARRSPGPSRSIDDGKARFLEAARAAVASVEAHELDKVVVVRRSVLEGCFDPLSLLDALERETLATRFAFSDAGVTFVGATPELLVRWDGQQVWSEAVAGTLRRGRDPRELEGSAKERLEHEYVVRAVSAALSGARVELAPPRAPEIRSLRYVHHLVTPIEGRRVEGCHVLDLVSALHPTPAVLGVPADTARAFLRQNERFERGWFAAPVGVIDESGAGTFVVALRSALISTGRAWVFAGSGVVRGSEPEAELAETEAKLTTILAALRPGPSAEPRLEGAP